MDKKLKNNVAVVTGAARGIGLAIAERLACDGARLVVADLDEAELDKATQHLAKEFGAEVVNYAAICRPKASPRVRSISRSTASAGWMFW